MASRIPVALRSRWFTGHLTYSADGTAHGGVLRQPETLRPRVLARRLAAFIDRRLRPRLRPHLADIQQAIETWRREAATRVRPVALIRVELLAYLAPR